MPDSSSTPNLTGFSHIVRLPAVIPDRERPRVWLEWRGLALANPPRLEPVPEGVRLAVTDRWLQGLVPFFRIKDPGCANCGDFRLRWIVTSDTSRTFALIELAPDWLDREAGALVVVEVIDANTVASLDLADGLRAIAAITADVERRGAFDQSTADKVFGQFELKSSAQFRQHEMESRPGKFTCPSCEAGLTRDDRECPRCGDTRSAPACPRCSRPVSNARSVRAWFENENGLYPWHYTWNGKCVNCGFEFVVETEITTGHPRPFTLEDPGQTRFSPDPNNRFAGRSRIRITPGESIHTALDEWDYEPTVQIEIERAVPGNVDSQSGSLAKSDRIVLTAAEWETIKKELEGPLGVLFRRRKYNRDTT
jgi:hypothetical protein